MAVFPHGKGFGDVWYQKQLVEIVHNEFPSLISHLKLNDSENITTKDDHREARKLGLNRSVVLDDGSSYYPIGLGVMSSKESAHDTIAWMHLSRQIEGYAKYISKRIGSTAFGHGVKTNKLNFSLGFAYDQHQQLFYVQCKSHCGEVISLSVS